MCAFVPEQPDELERVYLVFLPSKTGFAVTPDCVTDEQEAARIWGVWYTEQRDRRMRYAMLGIN